MHTEKSGAGISSDKTQTHLPENADSTELNPAVAYRVCQTCIPRLPSTVNFPGSLPQQPLPSSFPLARLGYFFGTYRTWVTTAILFIGPLCVLKTCPVS